MQREHKGDSNTANKMGPGPFSDPEDNDLPELICSVQFSSAFCSRVATSKLLSEPESKLIPKLWNEHCLKVQADLGPNHARHSSRTRHSTDTTQAAAANLHQWRGCLVHLWVHTQAENRVVSARKRHFHCQGVSQQYPLTHRSHTCDPSAEGTLYTRTPQPAIPKVTQIIK